MAFQWKFWARPNQLEPEGDWRSWLVRAGRGWGKTRVGAEWVRKQVETGQATRIALVGATAADVRDVMVEGPSGMLAISPPGSRPVYEPSKRRLTWPNGAVATTFSADEPDRLRGPQHDAAWVDEIAARRFPETWDMLLMGLRMGRARCCITTTPRPTDLIRSIRKNPATVETVGTTFENRSNLAPEFFASITIRAGEPARIQ
jgi:phage terminase large subunit-like protein